MKLIETTQQLRDNLQDIADMKEFGYDKETTGLDPHTCEPLTTQIGNEKEQYIIDQRTCSIKPLKPILEDESIKKIGGNLSFDFKWDMKQGFYPEMGIDVQNAERLLFIGIDNLKTKGRWTLENLASKYLNKQLNKEIRDSFLIHKGAFSLEQLEYMCNDVVAPLRIWKQQKDLLLKKGLMRTFRLETDVLPVFAEMEFNGIYLDKEQWIKLYEENYQQYLIWKEKAKKVFGKVMDINLLGEIDLSLESNPQMNDAFARLGYRLEHTNEAIISVETPKEIHEPILKYREYAKAVSTYGLNWIDLINPITRRIHAGIWQIGTASGRNSGTNPNPLNIPREDKYRSCYKAQSEEGMLIINDWSGQEISIMTEITREPEWLDIINNKGSVHALVASRAMSILLGKEVTVNKGDKGNLEFLGNKTSKKKIYNVFKQINFALGYGAGPKRTMEICLGEGISCNMDQAKEIVKVHQDLFYITHDGLNNIRDHGLNNEYGVSLGGRKRFFPYPEFEKMKGKNRQEKNQKYKATLHAIKRELGNHCIQASGADMIKTAAVLIKKKRKQLNKLNELRCLLLPYDECVFESEKNHEENNLLIRECMNQATEKYLYNVPCDIEGGISKCWNK